MNLLKYFSFLIAFLFLTKTILSQDSSSKFRNPWIISTTRLDSIVRIHCSSISVISDTNEMALIIINDHQISPSSKEILNLINVNNIDSVHVYQKNDTIAKSYGAKGKNGVIIIRYKKSIKLLTLEKMFNKFHIEKKSRNLKICINKNLIPLTQEIIYDPTVNIAMEVISDKYLSYGKEISTKEIFINIFIK